MRKKYRKIAFLFLITGWFISQFTGGVVLAEGVISEILNEETSTTDEFITVEESNLVMDNPPPEEPVVEETENTIETGEAIAVADSINVVNTSIDENSSLEVQIINKVEGEKEDVDVSEIGEGLELSTVELATESGELEEEVKEIDETEKITEQLGNDGGEIIINLGELDTVTKAEAVSGENETGGGGEIVSGDSIALANSEELINTNVLGQNIYWAEVNILGNFTGDIVNWSEPGSVEKIENGRLVFAFGENIGVGGGGSCGLVQSAEINNKVVAKAVSGQNVVEDEGNIKTGNSLAIANLINLINTHLRGSNIFWGVNNIGGEWTGNIIFSYPDLEIGVTSNKGEVARDEEMEFLISFRNKGHDPVENYQIEIGTGDNFEISEKDPNLSFNGGRWMFNGGYLLPGDEGSLVIKGYYKNRQISKGIVKKVWAAEMEDEVLVEGLIMTGVRESSLNNNSSLASARVVWEDEVGVKESNSDEEDAELPVIEIKAKNNVVEGIYPGDIVTFMIELENKSGRGAYDSVLIHQILDENEVIVDESVIGLGEIIGNKKGKIDFGVYSGFTEVGKEYHSLSWVEAKSEKGVELRSNETETWFKVLGELLLEVNVETEKDEVLATEGEGEVLGACTEQREDILVYILLFGISFVWINRQIYQWAKEIKGDEK